MEGRTIDVAVISATDLKQEKKFGQNQKCYAVVHVYPAVRQTTEMDHYGGANPTWNARLPLVCYEAHLHPPSSHSYSIAVDIFCKHSFIGQDKHLGNVTLPLADISTAIEKGEPFEAGLTVIRPSGEAQGTLNLSVKVGPKRILEPCEDPSAPQKSTVSDNQVHTTSSPRGSYLRASGSPAESNYSKASNSPPPSSSSKPKAYSSGVASSPQEDVVTGYPVQGYPALDPLGQQQAPIQQSYNDPQTMLQRGYPAFDPLGQVAARQQQQGYCGQQAMLRQQRMGGCGRRRGCGRRNGCGRRRRCPMGMMIGGPLHLGMAVVSAAVGKMKEHNSDRRITSS